MKQITVGQRQKIVRVAERLGYNLDELEFRTTGVRYGYWKDCSMLKLLVEVQVGIPVENEMLPDDDCGTLYFMRYERHVDNDFPDHSHNIRYGKVPLSQGITLTNRKSYIDEEGGVNGIGR